MNTKCSKRYYDCTRPSRIISKQDLRRKSQLIVRCGVRTHAHFRVPELKSGALDRSANLTTILAPIKKDFQFRQWGKR